MIGRRKREKKVEAAETPAPPKPVHRESRGRRWRRRLGRLFLFFVIFVVVLRFGGPYALPLIFDRVLAMIGLEGSYEEFDLHVLDGKVLIRGLEIGPPAEEGEATPDRLVELTYAHFDVDISELFSGHLRVNRAEIDGLELHVARDEAGRWNFMEVILANLPESSPEEPDPEPDDEESPLSLQLPVEIDFLAAQSVRIHFNDAGRLEPFEMVLELSATAEGLGNAERPARLDFQAHSPGILDLLKVRGQVLGGIAELDGELEVLVARVQLEPLTEYLQLLGLGADARVLSARMNLEVGAEPVDEERLEAQVAVDLTSMMLLADSDPVAGIESVHFEAEAFSFSGIRGLSGKVIGPVAGLRLLADGALAVAGLKIGGRSEPGEVVAEMLEDPEQEEPESASEVVVSEELAPAEAPPGGVEDSPPPFLAALDFFEVVDGKVELTDEHQSPPITLELVLQSATVRDLGFTEELAADPTQVDIELQSPGVLKSLHLQGRGHPFASSGAGSFEVAGEGLTLERIEPYLRAIGLEWTPETASLKGRLETTHERTEAGGVRGGLRLADIGLTSGDETLFALGEFAVEGLALELGSHLTIDELRIAGTRAGLLRDAEQRVNVCGLRTLLRAPSPEPDPPAESSQEAGEPELQEPEPAAEAAVLKFEDFIPRFALGRLSIEDTELRVADEAVAHPYDLRLTDLGLELVGLEIDAAAETPMSAHLSAHFVSPGIVKRMSVEGDLTPRSDPLGLSVALECAIEELERGPLAPYIEDAGLKFTEGASNLGVKVAGDLRLEPGGFRLAGSFENMLLEQEDVEWVSVDRLACDEITLGPAGIGIGTVELGTSRLALAREADGSLRCGMLALPPPAVEEQPVAAPAQGKAGPDDSAGASKVHRPKPPGQVLTEALAPLSAFDPPIALERLKVAEASLFWKDEVPESPIEATITVGGELSGVVLGQLSDPAEYGFDVRFVDSDTHLELKGEIGLLPDDLRLAGEVRIEGLRDGPLLGYLPPPQRLILENGHGGFEYEITLANGEGDVRSSRFEARNIELREGDEEVALLACTRMTFFAPHIDLPGAEVRIGEIVVEAFELSVARGEDGKSMELLGFHLAPPAAPAEPPPEEGPAPFFLELTSRELLQLRLSKLDLGLARLTLMDHSEPEAAPVEITGRLSTPREQILLGPEPNELVPVEFHLELTGGQLFESIQAEAAVTPFVSEPELTAKFSLEGLDGERLLATVPALAEQLDGREMKNGTAAAELLLSLQFLRRGPLDFDLSNGFGGELSLSGIELRDAPGGELLGGIDSIYADVKQIRPKSGAVNVRSVEIDGIYGRVVEDEEGYHALGMILKKPAEGATAPAPVPTPTESPAGAQETAANEAEPVGAVPEGPQAAIEQHHSSPDIRVDQFLVSGLDFEVRSTHVSPPMVLPITDLEFDVKRFSTRGFEKGIPMQLRVRVSAGEIELPVRTEGGAFLGGLVGGISSVVSAGSDEDQEVEPRSVFDEVAIDGTFIPGEHPQGSIRLRVRDLELPTFSSQVAARGVDLGDGQLDMDVKANIEPAGRLKVESTTTIRHLSLRDGKDGLIRQFLKLPVPLDTTLDLLKNDEGSQVIPLSFDVDASSGVSTGQIAAQASAAFLTVVTNALASSPVRLGKGVLDFTGIGGLTGLTDAEEPPRILGEPMALAFEPGGVVPSMSDFEAIASLVEESRDDERVVLLLAHQLGEADVKHMERIANPDPELCAEIGERLRHRRAELVHERRELAFRMHALFAVGQGAEAEAHRGDLVELDRELGRVEQALDVAYDHLRHGAERRRGRRTRHAADALAVERMHVVRRELMERFGSDLTGRIEIRNPRFHDQTGEETGRVRVVARRSGEAKQKSLFARLFGWLPFIG